MTTIAVTKHEIAWDMMESMGNVKRISATDKVIVINGVIYGVAGDSEMCEHIPHWHAKGAKLKDLPEGDWEMLVVNDKGLHLYANEAPRGFPISFPFAIGSGGKFALVHLSNGMSAIDAVKKAAELDIYTGAPFKSLNLSSVTIPKKKKLLLARKKKPAKKA